MDNMDLHEIYEKAKEFDRALDVRTVGDFAKTVETGYVCGSSISYDISYSHYTVTFRQVDEVHDEIWEDGEDVYLEGVDDLDEVPYSNYDEIGVANLYFCTGDIFERITIDGDGVLFTLEVHDDLIEECPLEKLADEIASNAWYYSDDYYYDDDDKYDLNGLKENYSPAFDSIKTDLEYSERQLKNILTGYVLGGQELAELLSDVQVPSEISDIILYAVSNYDNPKSLDDIKDWLKTNGFNSLSEIADNKTSIEALEDWSDKRIEKQSDIATISKTDMKKEGVQAKTNITKE